MICPPDGCQHPSTNHGGRESNWRPFSHESRAVTTRVLHCDLSVNVGWYWAELYTWRQREMTCKPTSPPQSRAGSRSLPSVRHESDCGPLVHIFAILTLFMAALCNREAIIFLPCSFFPSIYFFPRLISAVGDWMFTVVWHMVWP